MLNNKHIMSNKFFAKSWAIPKSITQNFANPPHNHLSNPSHSFFVPLSYSDIHHPICAKCQKLIPEPQFYSNPSILSFTCTNKVKPITQIHQEKQKKEAKLISPIPFTKPKKKKSPKPWSFDGTFLIVVIFDQINYYRVIGFDIRKFKIGKRKQKEM